MKNRIVKKLVKFWADIVPDGEHLIDKLISGLWSQKFLLESGLNYGPEDLNWVHIRRLGWPRESFNVLPGQKNSNKPRRVKM